MVGHFHLDAQLQQRPAHRPGEPWKWLAVLCAPGLPRVFGGGVVNSPLHVAHNSHPLPVQARNLVAQGHDLVALRDAERIGRTGDARCLVQQLSGAPLHEARALLDGVGQVPPPRGRGVVERRLADGLQVSGWAGGRVRERIR